MIRDPDTGWAEATITINGVPLTFAEAMALRVAVSSYRMWLHDATNREGLGARLADAYDSHLAVVEASLRGPR